ncbi:aminotransferase class V-fold PLP-dependent enzyme [Amylibacter sp.]|jgi:cystathionine gamma-synthase|nr:aminotransferase class V-fold PLP-dependent enzyme [Amylibacter sp.]MDC0333862.1 aminotransferase class V-fold PLP-dependent enzyme [Amylibacter sp.]
MTKKNHTLSTETKMAQALRYLDKETGAIVPPIQSTATYARDSNYEIKKPYWYRRDGNETTSHAEKMVAELEDATETLLFASGMSAATSVIDSLNPNAHVVIPKAMYHGVLNQFQTYETKKRLKISYYTAGNLEELSNAMQNNTSLVWVETPNNPDWAVTDISKAADIAHSKGAKLLTDCTATPPCATKALNFGADISMHSATKYLNGHSDITSGSLSIKSSDAFWEEIVLNRKLQGSVLQSFDAFLLIRGMRTLFLRFEKATENAIRIAHHFEHHKLIEKVLYPGLASHPGHAIQAAQTSRLFGGMMSLITKGNKQTAIDVARYCNVFYPATSLGGVESLIEHRATVSGDDFPVHPNLLRLSIGIEDVNDLIDDLEQALERANT